MPSTAISNIYYFPEKKTLRIIYISGGIYDYQDVPENRYSAMKSAVSKGAYLNKYIKGKYEFKKIE